MAASGLGVQAFNRLDGRLFQPEPYRAPGGLFSMRKPASIGLLVIAYAALAAFAAWAIYSGSKEGGGWSSLVHAWPYLLAGVLTVAVVTGLFVWLAFYSEKRGYDDRAGVNKP